MLRRQISTLFVLALAAGSALGTDFTTVPMYERGAVTFYVSGQIDGYGKTEFMVDTGSAYVTINEKTLGVLKEQGRADYVKQLSGIMADGSRLIVPVYRISGITIGGHCQLRDVEAAVFSGATRNILGLSALKKTAPFTVSMEPPTLALSNCSGKSI
jgi:predicted aspartyl protease